MKQTKIYLLSACLATMAALGGCASNKPEKITEIPVTTQSNEAKASVISGLACQDQGDLQKTRALFAKATEQDPKCGIAWTLKALTDATNKDFADDLAKAKVNLEGASDYEKLYYDYVSTFASSDWNKRLEVTKKIADAYPDAARAQADLGATFSAGNQEDKARECFAKAVSMTPGWAGGYAAMTNSYIFTAPKDFKKAEENALKLVEVAPSSSGAQISLGDCYRAQNDFPKARDAYAKAITLDPAMSEPYYKKGHVESFLGSFDDARKSYTEAATHDETKSPAILNIGNTYLYADDYKAALKWLNDQSAALDASGESKDKITADKFNCLSICASIALHRNDMDALKDAVAKLEPLSTEMGAAVGTNEAVLQQKGNMLYWQSVTAAASGNFDEAKAKAEEMKTTLDPVKDPNKLDGYEFALGYMSMKQKNYADAISHFEKTQQNNIYNKYWLAQANESAGNKEKAIALLKDITDYNFNATGYALIRNDVKKKLAGS
ncbi:MAG: tetratricopeptide repeat protein [Bacteroidia bacterium]